MITAEAAVVAAASAAIATVATAASDRWVIPRADLTEQTRVIEFKLPDISPSRGPPLVTHRPTLVVLQLSPSAGDAVECLDDGDFVWPVFARCLPVECGNWIRRARDIFRGAGRPDGSDFDASGGEFLPAAQEATRPVRRWTHKGPTRTRRTHRARFPLVRFCQTRHGEARFLHSGAAILS